MLDLNLIDTGAFVRESRQMHGEAALREFDERVWSHELLADRTDTVSYVVQGGYDRWQRPFLDITLSGSLKLFCQRCLTPVEFALDDRSRVVLFADEAQWDEAMADDDAPEGVLWQDELDVKTLVEDQLLMALPFSPMHEHCSRPAAAEINQDKTNPFAVLAELNKNR